MAKQMAADEAFMLADVDGDGLLTAAQLRALAVTLLSAGAGATLGAASLAKLIEDELRAELQAAAAAGAGCDYDSFVACYNRLLDRLAMAATCYNREPLR